MSAKNIVTTNVKAILTHCSSENEVKELCLYTRRGLIMGKKRWKKRIVKETEDFGTCVLHCKDCDYKFEMEWETIFAIQECTHGYVGYHLNDVFIDCPKCHEIISDNFEDEHILPNESKTKPKKTLDELPF